MRLSYIHKSLACAIKRIETSKIYVCITKRLSIKQLATSKLVHRKEAPPLDPMQDAPLYATPQPSELLPLLRPVEVPRSSKAPAPPLAPH